MADYTGFFLNVSGEVFPIQCIEISHPSFSQVYRYTLNDDDGVTADSNFYKYAPMSIKRSNVSNDLDQTMSITFADMDDELMTACNAIPSSDYSTEAPAFVYKVFRSDDLDEAMLTMQTLEIVSMSKDSTGLVTFDAKAPELNSVRTGVVYDYDEFPLLRGI